MKKNTGKVHVKCTKCRTLKWVPGNVIKEKIKRIRAKTHRPNAGYRCAHCV